MGYEFEVPPLHVDAIQRVSDGGPFAEWLSTGVAMLRGATPRDEEEKKCLASAQALQEFLRCGQQVYCVGPAMQKMLGRMSVKGVDGGHLRSPFPCIYIALQDSEWLSEGRGGGEDFGPVLGIYVHEFEAYVSEEVAEALKGHRGQEVERRAQAFYKPREGADTVISGMFIYGWGGRNAVFDGGYDFQFAVMRDSRMDLEEFVEDGVARAAGRASEGALEGASETSVFMMRITRFVVNFMLYLMSEGRQVEEPTCPDQQLIDDLDRRIGGKKGGGKKVRVLQRRRAALSLTKVSFIGRSVEESLAAASRRLGDVRAAPAAHMREAHWHWYWKGPRKDEHGNPQRGTHKVHKLVEATWINADVAVVVERHVRKVEDADIVEEDAHEHVHGPSGSLRPDHGVPVGQGDDALVRDEGDAGGVG